MPEQTSQWQQWPGCLPTLLWQPPWSFSLQAQQELESRQVPPQLELEPKQEPKQELMPGLPRVPVLAPIQAQERERESLQGLPLPLLSRRVHPVRGRFA